ncbi:MAG: NAD(P)/FAD-dependent oxidoreductase [Chloroflexota bacterium]|nr:NAD(P)/FAD-dependent oxidoreductase [Chloroflexota bacterium]MDE2945665.1 NAD(P)/FAD-dependent oxidoreductase [Chloroflexota bacterium]
MEIAIIGAGATGLAAAWDFAGAGHRVTIYEAADSVGGLAAGFKDERWDWSLEKFYHHWFASDSDILALADEMGRRDRVIFPRPKTSYWIDGKPVRSEISPSALFLPLSPFSTLRMGLAGMFIKFSPRWRPFERVTADQWMRRWMGREAYEKFFKPLLIGKFAEQYDQVPMSFMWARIVKRSLKLGTYVGGFQAFLDELAAQLRVKGVTIHLQARVDGIHQKAGKPALTIGGEQLDFDCVLSTTSPRLLLRMTAGLAETDYGRRVSALKSIGGLCVVFALKEPLMPDDTYWLNLPASTADKTKSAFPFLALVEHTNYIAREHYGGDHIIYCGDYVPPTHEYFQLSEDELVERFKPALAKVNPAFRPGWIRKSWVWRAPYAQPVPTLNHSRKIPDLKTPLPGLYWASMSQVYPWDRGTNYAVEIGRRAARLAMTDAANPHPAPGRDL